MSILEDVDEAASTLRELMNTLATNDEAADTTTVTPMAITPSPIIKSDSVAGAGEAMPDLSDVYDNLVDLWISCLPRKTPGPARLSKEKLVRNVAAELCSSSLAVSIRDKSVVLPKRTRSQERPSLTLTVRTKTHSFEQTDGNAPQTPSSVVMSNLASPVEVLSSHPIEKATSFGDPTEDEAILRLRGYGLSINSPPRLSASMSAILAHWPSAPGADPSKYSWEASRAAIAEGDDIDSDEEEAVVRQRERERRNRRSEKFLKRQRVNTMDADSQPIPTVSFGSQPGPVQQALSSQAAEISMTQPDRGAFGRRLGQRRFKKRRTIGF
jgi:RNA polymerase I-specific transcription initiation factor RRN6